VSLDELYNYFKEMNEVEHEHIKIVINLNEDNHDDVLNVRMSPAEIENVSLLFSEKRFNIFHNCLGTDLAELRMLQVILS
jgi:hypothetical protein